MTIYKSGLIASAAAAVLTLCFARYTAARDSIALPETSEESFAAHSSYETNSDGMRIFTAAELSYYDGTSGKPAYIAYKGFVYDVSIIAYGGDGMHHGHPLGTDFTSVLDEAPHGADIIKFMPVAGIYNN